MEINTYPAMNEQIKDLLRLSSNPAHVYAAKRIEELEEENKRLREALQQIIDTPKDWLESYEKAYGACVRIASKALSQ